MKPYRITGAALGWFTCVAQFYLNTRDDGLVLAAITYFGFFTMLGNIQVALAFASPLFPRFPGAAFFNRPGVRTAIAVYIVVVDVIFYLLLRKTYNPPGFGAVLNVLLHYIMPPLYVLDWVAFVPKGNLTYRQIPAWLIFPIAYAVVTLVRGAYTRYYPYPFLDAGRYGYHQISINIAVLSLFFILLSVGFVALGRWQAGFGRDGTRVASLEP
jgi:hypothetical protein